MHKGFHLKTLLAGSASSDNRIFSLALWCDLVTVSLVASNRDSINLDTVTVYLNRSTHILCHCLWKYGISELSIVHENAVCLYQGLLLLTNIDGPF